MPLGEDAEARSQLLPRPLSARQQTFSRFWLTGRSWQVSANCGHGRLRPGTVAFGQLRPLADRLWLTAQRAERTFGTPPAVAVPRVVTPSRHCHRGRPVVSSVRATGHQHSLRSRRANGENRKQAPIEEAMPCDMFYTFPTSSLGIGLRAAPGTKAVGHITPSGRHPMGTTMGRDRMSN